MSLLLSCQSLSKSFSTRLLFQELSLSIFSGDRIGLIGPNGSGKSTLLKILAGLEKADEGVISPRRHLKIGYVPQSCEFPDMSPRSVLICALEKDLQTPDYEKERLADMWLSKLEFKGEEPSAHLLSGGWKKRLSIAQALILSPDLLFLDEPTNHLDLEGILWLEKFLVREAPTYLLVSHDRYFLERATNRIIELNRVYPKGLFAVDRPYGEFLALKESFLAGQLEQERSLASKARKETEWLSQSPKARTSKSKARVDKAYELLEDLSSVKKRNQQKRAEIDFSATERQTRKLLVAHNLCKKNDSGILFHHLDFTLSPGTRMGLIGPNGSGKTTLLRLLAGETLPDQGTIKKADPLQIVYFDQHRTQLRDGITLREALSPNGDFVLFRGEQIHVNGWCKRFLFSPDLLDRQIGTLSGGERARISIAHLMLQPADILLLDEPTNDLDIATLETLEESLLDFPGAVVLITHDRCMLDRICNTLLILGNPNQTTLFSDYSQWEASLKTVSSEEKPKEKKKEHLSNKQKLSYAEKKEYEEIEGKILKLEEEVRTLNHKLGEADVAENALLLSEICAAIALAETKIEQLYLRWQHLDQLLH
ncbi:MAG: hypothetical protein RLZZ453_745 [Chlamydiota bacterium]|jgi:ATP-binding cassette subfamily F protein uup